MPTGRQREGNGEPLEWRWGAAGRGSNLHESLAAAGVGAKSHLITAHDVNIRLECDTVAWVLYSGHWLAIAPNTLRWGYLLECLRCLHSQLR